MHADQRGTISIVSVFALLLFTMLLVMVVNVGRHLDDKLKMQNAADAAAYSGGVVLARGMNALAYTNHLLCDVFAVTAFLREGRDRNAERLTAQVLDAWERIGRKFAGAEFDKWRRLGQAILDKAEKPDGRERELVTAWGEMTAKASEFALPVFEHILRGGSQDGAAASGGRDGLIPQFQRTVIETIPRLAQQAADEIAGRHATAGSRGAPSRGPQTGVLWRMDATPLTRSREQDPWLRTLPVVDASAAGSDRGALPGQQAALYLTAARTQRRELAKHYLELWTSEKLALFEEHPTASTAQMSQFVNLWRILTCGQLERLLGEYPTTNLPVQLRRTAAGPDLETLLRSLETRYELSRLRDPDREILMGLLEPQIGLRDYLEQNFHFLAVVYRRHLPETGPGLFRNPLSRRSDAQAFAQVTLYLPQPRWVRAPVRPPAEPGLGGTIGFDPSPPPPDPTGPDSSTSWTIESWPVHWDLLNQNWTCKLVAAEAAPITEILQTDPGRGAYRLPNLSGVTPHDLRKVTTH